jgi:primosomal protein N' (replication factor Y) (superfamily II helicase)
MPGLSVGVARVGVATRSTDRVPESGKRLSQGSKPGTEKPDRRTYVDVAVAAGPALPRRAGSGLPGVYSYHLADGQPVNVGSLVEVPFGSRLLPGLVVAIDRPDPGLSTKPIERALGSQPLASPVGIKLAVFVATTYRAPLFECLCLVLPPGFARRLKQAQRDGAWSPPRFQAEEPLEKQQVVPKVAPNLNHDQREALQEILAASRAGSYQPFLLDGVTGSGKTLVYLEAVAELVSAGKQVIVLASEIGLTPEVVARFHRRFPGRTALLHSRLSAAEHYRNWVAVAEGRAQVVIGSRSALFAPAKKLSLIVLDEEHEWTYKQDASPRYHARDVALELGRLAGAPVVLSSATPDVATTWRARTGELKLLRLHGRYAVSKATPGTESSLAEPGRGKVVSLDPSSRRLAARPAGVVPGPSRLGVTSPSHTDLSKDMDETRVCPRRNGDARGPSGLASLPPVEVVDLRAELAAGNTGIFSRSLSGQLGAALERGEQAILFINRRGAATCVTCRHCGHVVSCRRCEVPLVYHRVGEALICHRCNRRRPMVERCPACGGRAVRHFGVGTQRVEHELEASFPGVVAIRWDRDAGRAKGADADILERFRRHEAQVLIGTQMVAKALDFPTVTLVGVVLADVGLYLPDFRAAERSFQLLTQVAGRSGRGQRPGRVIVQTYSPTHYAVRFAAAHDYDGFYEAEIGFRAAHGYPPFGRLVRFVYSHNNEQRCWRESGRLRHALQKQLEKLGDPELRLIGPAPCYVERLRGRYRWQLIARGERFDDLLEGLVLPPGWIIDVDPVNLL